MFGLAADPHGKLCLKDKNISLVTEGLVGQYIWIHALIPVDAETGKLYGIKAITPGDRGKPMPDPPVRECCTTSALQTLCHLYCNSMTTVL